MNVLDTFTETLSVGTVTCRNYSSLNPLVNNPVLSRVTVY